MKKFVTFILVCAAVIIGFKITKGIFDKIRFNAYLKRVKEGWYVEITADTPLNVRDEPKYNAYIKQTVNKGEIYKANDYIVGDDGYYWINIDLYDGGKGWVANPKRGTEDDKYLISHNGTVDIASPTLKWKSKANEYNVLNYKDINYDNLEVWDDRDISEVTITHEVCIETRPTDRPGPQYWITFVATDKAGKTSKGLRERLLVENGMPKEVVKELEECEF